MRIDEPDGSIEKTAERLRKYACVSVGMSLKQQVDEAAGAKIWPLIE